jgi:hypothetical protein
MRAPSVRLVTSAHLPDLAPDDQELLKALRRLDVPTEVAVWDDPNVQWDLAPVTVIRSVFDYHLRRPEFLAWLARIESVTHVHNSPETIRWNSHKSYLDAWGSSGFPVIPTEYVAAGTSRDLRQVREQRGWRDVVLKPAVSASAYRTVQIAPSELAAGQAHLDALTHEGDALIQPYLPEFETVGESSFIWLGGHQTHCVRRPSGMHTSLEEAHVGEPLVAAEEELALASRAYAAITPPPLYARIDLIRTEEYGLLLLEVELVEPALYLRHSRELADHLAGAVQDLIPG